MPEEVDVDLVRRGDAAATAARPASRLRHLFHRHVPLLCCDLLVRPELKGKETRADNAEVDNSQLCVV